MLRCIYRSKLDIVVSVGDDLLRSIGHEISKFASDLAGSSIMAALVLPVDFIKVSFRALTVVNCRVKEEEEAAAAARI